MAEYIKREDALNAIRKSPISNMSTRLLCIDAIADIPAADVVEVKHAEWWKSEDELGEAWMCTECMEEFFSEDTEFPKNVNFCPNCGAEMESADDV